MNSIPNFKLINGELIFANEHGGLLWHGKPLGVSVTELYPIRNTEDCLVLLNGLEIDITKHRNILRVNRYGEVLWEVVAPDEKFRPISVKDEVNNIYTAISRINSNTFLGFAYFGYSDEIDILTGEIIHSEFVK